VLYYVKKYKAYPLLLDLGLLLNLVSAVHHLLFGDVVHHAITLVLGLGITEVSSGLLLWGLSTTLLLRVAYGFLGEVLQVGVTIVLLGVLLVVPWDVGPLSWLLLLLVLVGVHRL
jgi:hypothetical protein